MAERGRYRTKQQEIILSCLEKQKEMFCTVEQFMECLHRDGIHVGQTTVYRALERLTEDGAVVKIPSVDGSKAQFRYIGEDIYGNVGKLVCLKCGGIIPLECSKLDAFYEHINEDHGFRLDQHHMVLYGYCSQCQ
ncbi:Fur family transcriptional regulator [Lacrimispora sp.]|jgi:Fur family ferric uptake transcriptional regulator|uniref:Fur family transcriptional regulator n=1 Tax=Lacrimispora sp. TaxID=2719234 RepID=UPI0028A767A0|nr:transcriptional repressor [Lacrimispora sp.]